MMKAVPILAVAGAVLAGCFDTGSVTRGERAPMWYSGIAPRVAAVSGTGLRVQGPKGYCIDNGSTAQDDDTAFFLFGSCASLANAREAGGPRTFAALTAAVSKGASGNTVALVDELDGFLRTEAGRAALSRTGQAGSVEILQIERAGDVVYVQARDNAPVGAGLSTLSWRAVTAIDGHVVTLGVYAVPKKPLSARRGRALAQEFVSALRTANSPVPGAEKPPGA